MLKKITLLGLIVIVGWLILPQSTNAQACDHTIPLETWKVDGVDDNIQPGDVICLQSGTRGALRLEDLVGTADQPIIIQNSGGKLIIDSDYSIAVAKSQYIRLTGSGSPDHKYGIEAAGTVFVGSLTTNVEVDHLEVYNPNPDGFAGMMVKTDPSCDPATWRENFTMYDVSLHDNYIHDITVGEGFYIGFTFYDGYERICDGQTITVYGHTIEGLDVYNNVLDDIGSEAIQVSSIPNGGRIYNNTIHKYGQRPFANYQNNGVQIGEGNAIVYNNYIEEGDGIAFILFGTGHHLYNNIIVNSGGDGIFSDDRREGNGNVFVNNTIINPGRDGIRNYNDEALSTNIIKNNIIVKPDNENNFILILNDNVPVDMSHNLTALDANEVGFVDVTQGDYHLSANSPAIDAGTDVSSWGVDADYSGTVRPYNGIYDQGAYEYKPQLVLSAHALDKAIQLSWEVDTTLSTEASWTISYNSPPSGTLSTITQLAPELRTYTLTNLTNYTLYTITLEAILSETIILSDTINAMPSNIFIYLPLVKK